MSRRPPNQPDPTGALASPILVLGAPRSGTTWLAKILDSHPDVLYRHEPDETLPSPPDLTEDAVADLIRDWASERGGRTVTKRPFFPKSWQPGWARGIRTLYAAGVAAASRLPAPVSRLGTLNIPDMGVRPAPRVVIKSVRWASGAPLLARANPASRILFILRHPCGQVASVMRGNSLRRFDLRTEGTDMPFDETAAIAYAARSGTDEAAFQALPDAAKYAWSWRTFNEPAYAALAPLPNVHIVLYEALCTEPVPQGQRILDFAGLDWNAQTADFITRSTARQGPAGYHAIFRDAVAAAERWRTTMAPEDQAAIRAVLASSPLARFWPDLATDHPAASA